MHVSFCSCPPAPTGSASEAAINSSNYFPYKPKADVVFKGEMWLGIWRTNFVAIYYSLTLYFIPA